MHPTTDHPPELFCVELRTARWADLVTWYRDVLGLRTLVRSDDDAYALLAAGAARLALLGRAEPGDASRRWSLAFEVESLAAVGDRLADSGQPVAPTAHPEGYHEIVCSDPDDNRVRVFTWPSRERSPR